MAAAPLGNLAAIVRAGLPKGGWALATDFDLNERVPFSASHRCYPHRRAMMRFRSASSAMASVLTGVRHQKTWPSAFVS